MGGLISWPVLQAYALCRYVAWMRKCVYMFVFVWACAHRPKNVAAAGLHYSPSFCSRGLDYPAVCLFYFFKTRSPVVQVGLELPYTAKNDFELLTLLYTHFQSARVQACTITSGLCDAGDGTQDFANAMRWQALLQLNYIPSPVMCICEGPWLV